MTRRRLLRWETLVLLVVTGLNVLPAFGVGFEYGRAPHSVRDSTDSPAAPYFYHGLLSLIGLYCLWNLIAPADTSDRGEDG